VTIDMLTEGEVKVAAGDADGDDALAVDRIRRGDGRAHCGADQARTEPEAHRRAGAGGARARRGEPAPAEARPGPPSAHKRCRPWLHPDPPGSSAPRHHYALRQAQ
jgi:hypothetical protein